MGRNSSGLRGEISLPTGDGNYKGEIKNVQDLVKIKDPEVYKAVGEAISRYHSVMGVRERKVKLADLDDDTLGVQVNKNGKSQAVYLNKKIHNMSKKDIERIVRGDYKSGWMTKTNKAIAHTVTHELAHATWGSDMKEPKHKGAKKEILKLYDTWRRDKTKRGYGEYAKADVDEFWAETVTKAVHGKQDKYTRAVKSIAKRFEL